MKKVAIGIQDFETVRNAKVFYIDKTDFIKEWWENNDAVTLIARPRRFGKTLTMDMLEKFFSVKYAGRSDLFEGLKIWEDEKYRNMQGSYPVIFLSFANVKEQTYEGAKGKICHILTDLYVKNSFLRESDVMHEQDLEFFDRVNIDMDEKTATLAIHKLCDFLHRYYGKKVIVLLDEYDTPMQEAYVAGYWAEIITFIRNLFNATFKTNPYLGRAVMTGITRVSKESVFSDLNNLEVVTTTSEKYRESFGFTEEEVFTSLDEHGLSDAKEDVKDWYDGFTFGSREDMYNPWSIINFLDKRELGTYWANTSSNSLVEKLIREGGKEIKQDFETLINGGSIKIALDEQIIFSQLDVKKNAIWSLLLASGYLKVEKTEFVKRRGFKYYYLKLTNKEVLFMFENMVSGWFADYTENYNDFIKSMLKGNLEEMNVYMNRVALETFSFFDTGNHPSEESQPERFYHGFVLGLLVELEERYVLTSNRESGLGRYDVILEPLNKGDDAFIIEFKVMNENKEKDLAETVQSALKQIEDMKYAATLIKKGIQESHIRKYGFAFKGKKVLIGDAQTE